MSYFTTHLSVNLLVKKRFKICEHFAKLQAKWFIEEGGLVAEWLACWTQVQ